ncbi:MAG TPA: preprotein translocase subunit YajC [Thiotrichaceae bacterium]|nr:preprotein translocase subunit YajC [Thiotrichaceae bacterium]
MGLFIQDAYAAAPQGDGSPIQMFVMIAIIFAMFYFFIIRPQQKRSKEHASLLESLSKGDEVVTTGGVIGKVTTIGENFIEIRVSDNNTLRVQKHAVTTVMPKGTMKNM